MKLTRRQIIQGGAGLAAGIALPAYAAYPDRDITFILNWSLSGSTYPTSKIFCSNLEKYLTAQGGSGKIIIESRVGGNGTIGLGMTVRAKPDGYTIGYAGSSSLGYQPLVTKGLAWRTIDDVQPLVKLFSMPTLLAVKADSPIRNFDDFMKEVRAKPGQVRVGVSGQRTPADFVLHQVNRLGNVQIRATPFSGGAGEVLLAALSGRIDACCGYTESLRGHTDSGQLRVIAVFDDEVYAPYPNATPVAARHFPEATIPAVNYVIAPKGLPPDIADKLIKGSQFAVNSDEYKNFARSAGMVHDPKGPDAIRKEIMQSTGVYLDLLKFIDGAAPENPYKT